MTLGGQGPMMIVILSVEVFLAAVFVAMRFYTRKAIKAGIGIDDYILIATWVLQAVFIVFIIVSTVYGLGQHSTDVRREDGRLSVEMGVIGLSISSLGAGLGKTAVAMFLMRIVVSTWHKAFLWFWIITVMAWSILLTISCFAQCTPVESLWDERVKAVTCPLNQTIISITACSWCAASDFFLAAFPWAVLWKLNMQKKEKITICISLSLGVLAGICGIVKTYHIMGLSHQSDYLYSKTNALVWTSSESTITIICVCVPVLRPLWVRFFGRTISDRYFRRHNGSHGIFPFGRRQARKIDTEFGLNAIPRVGGEAMNTTIVGASRRDSSADSEQSILQENGIKETREFTIVYEGGSSSRR